MSFIRRGRGRRGEKDDEEEQRRRRTVVQDGNTTRGRQPWGMAAQDEQGWAGDQRAPKGKRLGSGGRDLKIQRKGEGGCSGPAPTRREVDNRGKRRGFGKEELKKGEAKLQNKKFKLDSRTISIAISKASKREKSRGRGRHGAAASVVGKPDPRPIVETPSTARRTKDKRDERQGREKREKERERESTN